MNQYGTVDLCHIHAIYVPLQGLSFQSKINQPGKARRTDGRFIFFFSCLSYFDPAFTYISVSVSLDTRVPTEWSVTHQLLYGSTRKSREERNVHSESSDDKLYYNVPGLDQNPTTLKSLKTDRKKRSIIS